MKLLLGVFLFALLAFAQGTDAVVTGTVLDPTGAVMPETAVTALNTDTGVSITVKSNSAGVYEFPTLQPGTYTLSADKQGFKKSVLNAMTLRTGDHVEQNIKLEVGSTSESVQVTASAEGVQYLTASQGGVLNSQRIQDLPVNSRNAMDFVATQPGVVGTNFNGARNDMLNITLDGSNIQDNFITESIGTTQINTSIDRVEEVKVVTSPADAEYGRGSGQVQLVSRSGTNQYHGSVYDYAHNTDLNANSWSNNRNGVPRGVEVENQIGGRLGGPIKKNKTFFFGLFEGNIQHFQSTSTATVLTAPARQGIFRFFPGLPMPMLSRPSRWWILTATRLRRRARPVRCNRSVSLVWTRIGWDRIRPALSQRIWRCSRCPTRSTLETVSTPPVITSLCPPPTTSIPSPSAWIITSARENG